MKKEKRGLINYMGLLGVVSLLSYAAAVLFAPLAYPGYNWMAQAVSDLSAQNAPSKMLWDQLASLYGVCGMISVMMVCVYIQGRLTKTLRLGIYFFAAMNWVSSVGYTMFPLSESGNPAGFQNVMHVYVITMLVVLLSIVSLTVIIVGGCREKRYRSLAVFAALALAMMFVGAIGTGVVPPQYFGITERFSVFAATGFNAVLGVYLFLGFPQNPRADYCKCGSNGTDLPGYRKKSFAMPFGNGEIWFEHLDGMYDHTDLALQKLAQDWLIWKKPSSPALLAVNLDETKLDNRLLTEIADKLFSPEKRLLRVVFVGVGRADVQKLKQALHGATFALGFENDFEKAKQWLVSSEM